MALIAGSTATAAALVRNDDLRAWAAAAALPAGAIVAFVISRTVGLPQGADDIGNWTEPLGLASLFVEGLARRPERGSAARASGRARPPHA